MEHLNEFGQRIRGNTNNPHLAQLDVDGEEPTPWGTPQKIAPQEEEQHLAFSRDVRPITSNQGKRVQLVDGPSGQRLPAGQQVTGGTQAGAQGERADAEAETLVQAGVGKIDRQVQVPEQKQGTDQPPPM